MPRHPRSRHSLTNMTFTCFLLSIRTASHHGLSEVQQRTSANIVPGFLYTQSSNRLWRKNRQSTSGSSCVGHDINRNWPYKWSVSGGASTNPCAEDFKGTAQSDAPETTVMAAWLGKIKSAQGLKLYIDWHSYSQLFMTRKWQTLKQASQSLNSVTDSALYQLMDIPAQLSQPRTLSYRPSQKVQWLPSRLCTALASNMVPSVRRFTRPPVAASTMSTTLWDPTTPSRRSSATRATMASFSQQTRLCPVARRLMLVYGTCCST